MPECSFCRQPAAHQINGFKEVYHLCDFCSESGIVRGWMEYGLEPSTVGIARIIAHQTNYLLRKLTEEVKL